MPKAKTLSAALDQGFSRQPKMKPPKEKIHPAMKQAVNSFMSLHAGKFASNAHRKMKRGRG